MKNIQKFSFFLLISSLLLTVVSCGPCKYGVGTIYQGVAGYESIGATYNDRANEDSYSNAVFMIYWSTSPGTNNGSESQIVAFNSALKVDGSKKL